jgi:hypothetical protein
MTQLSKITFNVIKIIGFQDDIKPILNNYNKSQIVAKFYDLNDDYKKWPQNFYSVYYMIFYMKCILIFGDEQKLEMLYKLEKKIYEKGFL